MKCKSLLLSVLLIAGVCFVAPAFGAGSPLADYLAKADPSYRYEITANHDSPLAKVYSVKMTSQTWRQKKWTHWVSIVRPANVKHADKAILVIGAGSNKQRGPNLRQGSAAVVVAAATQLGVTVVVIEQVPNQPMFKDYYEDEIIAYTFDQYLRGRGDDWPLLLPMTKAAVRAMDATTAISKDKFGTAIDKFIVTGASKRGWTTYLTGAMDERVIGIAPMVFDMLDLNKQVAHQKKSYGRFSGKVDDYSKRNLQDRMSTPRGKQLVAIVDPFAHRAKLTMPKLLVLGTNDPYWTADSASLYFDALPEPKHIYYEPNAGHGLGLSIAPTLLAFFDATLRGKTLPQVTSKVNAEGALEVHCADAAATAVVWQAQANGRDFRKARWGSRPAAGAGKWKVDLTPPETGWAASFVQVQLRSEAGVPYGLSTPIRVSPDAYPKHAR